MAPMRMTRRFLRRPRMSSTPSANSGAATTSQYWAAIIVAVSRSSSRFTAMAPPKAAIRSAR